MSDGTTSVNDSSEVWETTAIAPLASGLHTVNGYPAVAVLVQDHRSNGSQRVVLGYADHYGRVWPIDNEYVEFSEAWVPQEPEESAGNSS
ncbi:hypothetical protein [Mycobacteroides abscessus]|uniref:hypothetical protein n=1 Tax=Mycobacteroides abscessus TaxID=36809 RepID=UPI0009A70687|nr:hypothetical protein [Mycobacteroides abscessus]SKU63087.1 Uncharacterised protein [Mycobacteroides abscessus subsp. massiliense]